MENHTFPPDVIASVHELADLGRYQIRGFGARRKVPNFDDLVFLTASASRYPLEGYRERCETRTVLGARHGAHSRSSLDIPITIAGMSFGALSAQAKQALGAAAPREVGTSTTTGDGGMLDEERQASKTLVYQCLPSGTASTPPTSARPTPSRSSSARAPSPAPAACCSGQKVGPRVAGCAPCPEGIDQRSRVPPPRLHRPRRPADQDRGAARGDRLGEVPIFVKIGASRVFDDVKLAVEAGADVVVVDGMEGGTGASPDASSSTPASRRWPPCARRRTPCEEIGVYGEVQLIVAGGIRTAPTSPRPWPWAPTPSPSARRPAGPRLQPPDISRQFGRNRRHARLRRARHQAGECCHHCHTGRCPVGITTQDPELLEQRLDADGWPPTRAPTSSTRSRRRSRSWPAPAASATSTTSSPRTSPR